jgi:hypothetical protein
MSIIRETVLAAQEVCKVASTKLPVSAALKANLNVSRSLISQTIITSLACLKAYFNQFSNDNVFVHTSLCSISDFLFLKTNSTGSSTVTICFDKFELIVSTSAAKVVDLPDHTLHVTRINQCFCLIKSKSFLGNHNSVKDGNSFLIGLKTIPIPFFAKKTLALNLECHFNSIEKSISIFSLKIFFCFSFMIDEISLVNSSLVNFSYSSKYVTSPFILKQGLASEDKIISETFCSNDFFKISGKSI